MSPITNCFDPSEVPPKLQSQRTRIFAPETDWTYSHHPSLAVYQGRFHAIWSNGRQDEDQPGQRVLTSSSADFVNWQTPTCLFTPRPGEYGPTCLTAAGFHQHGGQLIAYAGEYEYTQAVGAEGYIPLETSSHMRRRLLARLTHDGAAWGDATDVGLPVIPNHGPQPTSSGRLIISGNISFPYTDNPSGLSDWKMTGIYPPTGWEVCDDSRSFYEVRKMLAWRSALCEGSFYQTDDGVLHMLLRSAEKQLWLTESRDQGLTWCAPAPLQWSDCGSKFHFGRLPDGRFYCVSCPHPAQDRIPLVLQLSRDGVHFGRHLILADEPYEMKRPGRHKNGVYGYPHTLIHGEHLYVIYSLRKEAVEVLRVPLALLS